MLSKSLRSRNCKSCCTWCHTMSRVPKTQGLSDSASQLDSNEVRLLTRWWDDGRDRQESRKGSALAAQCRCDSGGSSIHLSPQSLSIVVSKMAARVASVMLILRTYSWQGIDYGSGDVKASHVLICIPSYWSVITNPLQARDVILRHQKLPERYGLVMGT